MKIAGIGTAGAASLATLSLLLTPALAAPQKAEKPRSGISFSIDSFTPAAVDPKLAAEFARRGFQTSSLRFTPSVASPDKSKAVKVAVRARAATAARAMRGETSATPVTAITPTAYNLGVSVGWRRFALSGDVGKVQGGAVPGGREAAEVGVSYSGKKFTGRLFVGAERTDETTPRILPHEESYSLDVGGSYRVARNLDVTGGVRYKIQNERLAPLAEQRQDSQAVYIGTAFRF